MRTRKSLLPLIIVLTILLSGLVFTPVLGMPQADLSWRTSNQTYLQAYFNYYPYDPNTCRTVNFEGYTYPYVASATYTWDFGDGNGAVGQYVNHRYAQDGTYQVTLTVTTPEGGMATAAQTVMVRTEAQFYYYPNDPSAYDTVTFDGYLTGGTYECSATYSWDFGDGTTAQGQYVQHRYAQDGDYLVTFTVAIEGGPTPSTTQTVMVRTHDVAITTFKVPQAARVGQTRNITVGIRNHNYEESVRVYLSKGQPGYGWQEIGSLQQLVPVRSGNRTTDFNFSYTFTAEDAAIGKVTFRAVAYLQNGRDALPADNEAIADPTKVSR